MKVSDIMSMDVVTVKQDTPYKDLWESIILKKIHSLPVVDTDNKLIGIISEEDLLKPLYPDYKSFIADVVSSRNFEDMEDAMLEILDLTAKHIMGRRVIFTRPDTEIMRAMSRMMVRKVRQLPVLDDEEILVGMVSKGDVFDAVFKKHVTGDSGEKIPRRRKKAAKKKKKKKT